MAVRLRLMRMGKKKQPTYRIVAADSRSPRDGRFLEIIGTYNPRTEPSAIKVDNTKALHWLHNGAQPSEAVQKLLTVSGAWDAFQRGETTLEAFAVNQPAGDAPGGAADADADEAPAPAAAAEPAEEPKAEEPAADAADEVSPAQDPELDSDDDGENNAVDESPYGEGSAAAPDDGSMPDGFPIKGNADSMKYHEPGGRYYDATVAEVWFATAEAAEAAGFTAPGGTSGSDDGGES